MQHQDFGQQGAAWIAQSQQQVQQDLSAVLQMHQWPQPFAQAIHHAVMLGGKRVRPALAYACAQALGADWDDPMARRAAVAVELIHCYSLVHDDLPCMDDDALRRGQPTCHVQYGEANALLTGDILQSLAFSVLTTPYFEQKTVIEHAFLVQAAQQVAILSRQASAMVVGQVLDLAAEQQQVDEVHLRQIHLNKTGALINAAITMGALAAKVDPQDPQVVALSQFGTALGLAFQVQDDILDVTMSTEVLGKPAGSDEKLQKSTYPALLGLTGAQQLAAQLHQEALDALIPLGDAADALRAIAHFLWTRNT